MSWVYRCIDFCGLCSVNAWDNREDILFVVLITLIQLKCFVICVIFIYWNFFRVLFISAISFSRLVIFIYILRYIMRLSIES